ncbi:hypothetical protein K3495_g736 [Podosphaera aphanis]|nr:hypothetical protein K3495_g736 [Podosphaera aphanis]
MEQLMAEMEMENQEDFENFFTEFGILNGTATIAILHDQSVLHAISQQNPFDPTVYCNPRETNNVFTLNHRYSSDNFQGIMPESGAAGVSATGHTKFQALQKLMPSLQLDRSTAGEHNIRFGKGNAISIGTVLVPTIFGKILFHVVPANTPFLLCINDMDRLGIKFDNIKNTLKQGKIRCAVTRK